MEANKEEIEKQKEEKLKREKYLDEALPLLRKEALYAKLHASIEQNNLIRLKYRIERSMIIKESQNDTSKKG